MFYIKGMEDIDKFHLFVTVTVLSFSLKQSTLVSSYSNDELRPCNIGEKNIIRIALPLKWSHLR